jgi:3-polyprenyl-4-hydroxybenzoate decarboxylase
MKDPDSGWINYGTYRVQSHKPNVASVMMSPGKHGLIIMRKYHERGQPCPVAVVAGTHPALVMLGGIEIPYGKNELEAAGGILGEPIEVISMPKTGLLVPANAEIAFEGFIHPDDKIMEGPLAEWTGYYASGNDREPAIRIDTLMYRDNPILVGAIPGIPPNDNTFYFGTYRCGAVWNQLEAAGIPGGANLTFRKGQGKSTHSLSGFGDIIAQPILGGLHHRYGAPRIVDVGQPESAAVAFARPLRHLRHALDRLVGAWCVLEQFQPAVVRRIGFCPAGNSFCVARPLDLD